MKRYCVKRREMQIGEKAYKKLLKAWDEFYYHEGITIDIGWEIGNIPDGETILVTDSKEEALEKLKEYKSTVARVGTYHGYIVDVTEYCIDVQESNDEYDEDDVEYWEATEEIYAELGRNHFEEDLIDQIHELMENLEALDADEDAEEIKSIKKELDELKAEVREERI